MNRESVRAWLDLTICLNEKISSGISVQRECKVMDFLGTGDMNVVFKVVGGDGEWVVKFPRTHIGFIINLPPNEFFPELSNHKDYEEKLMSRLRVLQGSPMLSNIHPLDELWTALAVQHFSSRVINDQSAQIEDCDSLADCYFVRERLLDWSSVDIGRSEEELSNIIVIYQGEKPIHADLPQILAENASSALKKIRQSNHGDSVDTSVRYNPFLPWISAASTGYTIPAVAASYVAKSLARFQDTNQIIKQATQILRYIVRSGKITRAGILNTLQFLFRTIDGMQLS